MLSILLLLWVYFTVILFTILLAIIFSIESIFRFKTKLPKKLEMMAGRVALLFHRVEVTGIENLLTNEPQIIYSNHQGNMDILLLSGWLKLPFCWMAKDSLFNVFLFGWVMKKMENIPVYRGKKSKTSSTLNEAVSRLENDLNVVIFPEGTWSHYADQLLPFKSGIYTLAMMSQKPLIPLCISGSNEVNPPDTFKMRLGTMKLKFYPPIYYEQYQYLEKDKFLEMVKTVLEKSLADEKG